MNLTNSRYFSRKILVTALLFLFGIFTTLVAAEDARQSLQIVSADVLKGKLKEVEESSNLTEEIKRQLTENYLKAQTNLEKADSYEADAASFAEARETSPVETEKLRKQLSEKRALNAGESLQLSDKISLPELEQLLQKEKSDFAAVEARLSNFNNRLEFLTSRPAAAREQLITARQKQEEINSKQSIISSEEDESSSLAQARKWVHTTSAHALSAEIKMLDKELLSLQPLTQLLQIKQEIAEQNVRFVASRVRLLEDAVSKRRLSEAEQVQQETQATQQEFKGKHPLVRELAEKNVNLGNEIQKSALKLEKFSAEDDEARNRARRIEEELRTIKQKLEVAGLSQALGQVLMEQRRSLPNLASIQKQARKREKFIAESSLRQIQYSEESRTLRDIDAYIAGLTFGSADHDINEAKSELRELAIKRRELLKKAINTEVSYLRILGELDLAQQQLIDAIQAYDTFLGKRLLWIRSTDPISISMFISLPDELARLISPSNWIQVASDMLHQSKANPLGIFLILALLFLVFKRRKFLQYTRDSSEKIGRIKNDNFLYTWQALGWTMLASAPLPLLMIMTGWQLSQAPEASEFSRAVAAGTYQMATDFLVLRFFADTVTSRGLAIKHFLWPASDADKLRRQLKLLMTLFLPTLFIVIVNIEMNNSTLSGSLTLLAVLCAISSIGLFVWKIFTPRGGILLHFLRENPESLLARLRPIWVSALMIYIAGLFVLVLVGYLYTGGTLTRDLIDTIWLIYLLVLARGLVMRWLLLTHRRLSYKALIEKREEARMARKAAKKGGDIEPDEEVLADIEEPEVNLDELDTKSRNLLNTILMFGGIIGLWLIWSPQLTAFSILDEISLWTYTATVDGVESVVPFTLANMGLVIILLVVTSVAVRGVPAILEFVLLQSSSITSSVRYTATTLTRYVIVGIGLMLFFKMLGVSWSNIQWLAAALSVGIGFGLQEIVANFISGLIILFERPVRVGDTVTVGGTSGVVSKINIRATTIINWDRQELLVPNKEFITNQLLNWSLSDPIIRVRLPVGIAYGSDVNLAIDLMKEAAEEHSNVLEDPSPFVSFETFGDNTMNLELRAYLPSMENRRTTVTELNKAINQKFIDAGIVIAFPQRDVHLDTNGPIDVRIHRNDDK